MITQLCKESKQWVHPNLQQAIFLLTFPFKFPYISIVDIWSLKRNLVTENKKPFTAIKTTTKHKCVTNLYIKALRKLGMQLEIPICLGYGPKALTYKAKMHKLDSIFFPNT